MGLEIYEISDTILYTEKELVDFIGDQFSKVHTKLDHLSETKADKVDIIEIIKLV